MTKHQALAREVAQELQGSGEIRSLILYGSVSRGEESAHSDLDLLAIVAGRYLQKRHEVRGGITVEYLEMHTEFLCDFIAERETPVLFALANGIVLFDKEATAEPFIRKARAIIEQGPWTNPRWKENAYATKRRSDLTEIYTDLLDTDDETSFHYMAALLVTTALPWLMENHG
jgi:predicted nucleotidyltransferase